MILEAAIGVCLFSLVLIAGSSPQKSISARREQIPFSMAIGNGELMHECFPKPPRMGTAKYKLDNETEEEGKKIRINVERSTADTKERSPVSSHWCVCSRMEQNTICKQRRCQTISDWFLEMSNWPSGGFVWFSQQLLNRQKATKIPAK